MSHLAFASLMSLVLSLVFLFVPTVRHKEHFVQSFQDAEGDAVSHNSESAPANIWVSFVFLLIALVGVIRKSRRFGLVANTGSQN